MKRYMVRTLVLAAMLSPLSLQAQAPALGSEGGPARALTLQAGGFTYEPMAAERAPMLGLRMNWAISPLVITEVGVSAAQVRVEETLLGQPGMPSVGTEHRRFGTLGVGIQAQAPLPYVQPYVGVSTGLVRQLDRPNGDRTVRPTHSFPLGVRVPLNEHVGVRGEVRYRFDDLAGTGNAAHTERTIGVSIRF